MVMEIVIVLAKALVVMGVIAGSLAAFFSMRVSSRSCDCAWCHEERQGRKP